MGASSPYSDAGGMPKRFFEATVTMLMGLSAVFVINIAAIREFILMIMILLAISMLMAIFVLPSIYSLYINWKMRQGAHLDAVVVDELPPGGSREGVLDRHHLEGGEGSAEAARKSE